MSIHGFILYLSDTKGQQKAHHSFPELKKLFAFENVPAWKKLDWYARLPSWPNMGWVRGPLQWLVAATVQISRSDVYLSHAQCINWDCSKFDVADYARKQNTEERRKTSECDVKDESCWDKETVKVIPRRKRCTYGGVSLRAPASPPHCWLRTSLDVSFPSKFLMLYFIFHWFGKKVSREVVKNRLHLVYLQNISLDYSTPSGNDCKCCCCAG